MQFWSRRYLLVLVSKIWLSYALLRGLKDGQEQKAVVDLFDYYDETTGFTSMERTTGWHAAIMAGFMARRQTPPGGVPVELAVPGQVFVEEFRKRGFDLRVSL